MKANRLLIDLSLPIKEKAVWDPLPPEIEYFSHANEGLEWLKTTFGVEKKDLVCSQGLGGASEIVKLTTHAGTHLDAPWHFGPFSEGRAAKTVDEIPLDWCYGNGVVLDVRHKKPGEIITVDDLKQALHKINYLLRPFDIVLIMTGWDKKKDSIEYYAQPGMDKESTLWLLEQGIKMIGIDCYSFDRCFKEVAAYYKHTGDGRVIWEAHFAGITKEYCHMEKLVDLDKIPIPYGFKVACFPVKVHKASAAWIRAVAIVEGKS